RCGFPGAKWRGDRLLEQGLDINPWRVVSIGTVSADLFSHQSMAWAPRWLSGFNGIDSKE
ncbi:hypothetical protein DSO57_1020687, partial [Entomophthora muscae]